MGTNISRIGLLITAAQFLLASGCGKNGTKPCPVASYSFSVTSEWAPQQEVYNIGDTIYLTSAFPKKLPDAISGQNIDYSNAVGIGGDMSVYYLDTVTHQPIPAKDSFILVTMIGSFSERAFSQNSGINFNYMEKVNSYEFKGGFVCKKKGIYGIGISDLKSAGITGKNCTNAGFSMTVINTDKHLHLHQYALNINPNDPYLQQKGYDFRVQ